MASSLMPQGNPSSPVRCMEEPVHSFPVPEDVENLVALLRRHRDQMFLHMEGMCACEDQLAERLLTQVAGARQHAVVVDATHSPHVGSHACQGQRDSQDGDVNMKGDMTEWVRQRSDASWNRDITMFPEEEFLDTQLWKSDFNKQLTTADTDDSGQSNIAGSFRVDRIKPLVASTMFNAFTGCIIVINCLLMGVELQLHTTHADSHAMMVITVLHQICGAIFVVELALRIYADQCSFFSCSDQWFWNYLDTFLVASSCFETGFDLARDLAGLKVDGIQSLSTARILRVLRITRVIRVLRAARMVRFVRSLRILLHSLISTLKEVFWTLLLISLIIYIFAMVLTQAAQDHLQALGHGQDDAGLRRQWGTLTQSSLTLFSSITGGLDWSQAFETLSKVGHFWAMLFFAYVAFMIFAVLNAITGAFCQAAMESQVHDRELQTIDLLSMKKDQLNHMAEMFTKLFASIDADGSGEITIEEFQRALSDEAVQVVLAALEFEPQDVWVLFRLLDKDNSGQLDVDEFVKGCLRMKGSARSIDLAKFVYESKLKRKQNVKFMKYVSEQFASLRSSRGAAPHISMAMGG